MKIWILLLLVVDINCTDSNVKHVMSCMLGCFDYGPTMATCTFDSDEFAYADYENQQAVYTIPEYISRDSIWHFDEESAFKSAVDGKRVCSKLVKVVDVEEKHPPDVEDPPVSMIYPAEEVLPGKRNRLVCFINGFHPPALNVTWTRNGVPVSQGVTRSRYYPNDDYSFRHISTLSFMPEERDVYTCSVEHQAIDAPDTKTWEVKFRHPWVVADVVCGLGLTGGVVLMAAGIILALKQKVVVQSDASEPSEESQLS